MNLQWMNVPTFIKRNFFNFKKNKNGLFYFIPLLKGLKLEPKLIKSVNFFSEFFFHFSGKEKG